MCDCEKALELISLDLDGVLTPQERQVLDSHLTDCPACAALARELTVLHQALSELNEEVPEGFHRAVMDRVHEEKVRPVPVSKAKDLPWRRWVSLAAVFAVVLIGAGSLGKSWTGAGSHNSSGSAGETPVSGPREATVSQEDAAGAGQAPELSLYAAQEDTTVSSAARDTEPKEGLAPESAPENTLSAAGPALIDALPTGDTTLAEELRGTLAANCSDWLQTAGFSQSEDFDASILTVEAVTQEDLETAICSEEEQYALLDLSDYRVTVGDSSLSPVLLCDSGTLEVLGYLPST